MSENNVIPFTGITRLDLDPDIVLESLKGRFKGIVIMGFDHSGEARFASSYADGGDVLWLMELFRKRLMEVG